MEIKVLGTGCCSACGELYGLMQKKVKELGIEATVTKSDDIMEIMSAGVMSTPAVLIDGKVVHAGGLPKESDIEKWLKDYNL